MKPPLEDPRRVLKRYGIRPKRSWGQNFLTNQAKTAAMADAVASFGAEQAVEIGAGLGTLTAALAHKVDSVIAVERDRDLAAVLRQEFADVDNVSILEANAAALSFEELAASRPTAVAGNLPYQLTGKLLRNIVSARKTLTHAVVMVQLEVAQRMTAAPAVKEYGVLSIMSQAWHAPEILFRLGPGSFFPRPAVASAVVRLVPRAEPQVGTMTEKDFSAVVHAAFSARRKTLRNALSSAYCSDVVSDALSAAGIDPSTRAERLTVAELAALAQELINRASERGSTS